MAPQWMPQNLQKRLLLYVLQQLSLFSEIDLDNLDVSLGSSSQITLSDVDIDTDAFKIPGIHLRNGRLKNLVLQLNVTGGVNIDVDGFSITMTLASTAASKTRPSNLPKSPSDGILDDKSRFSLAQSTMELANSIIQDDDEFKTPNQSIHINSLDEIPTGECPDTQPQSTFNSMMNKAVEVALSKLNVTIKNVTVRVLMDHATVDLEIEKATFVNKDDTRTIDLSDIKIIGVHPGGRPGEKADEVVEPNEPPTSQHEDEVETSSDSGEDEDDNDDDFENDAMMSSSFLERKDLNDSVVYSNEEASTIYMSATSNAFDAKKQEQLESSNIMHINKAQVTFEGLSQVEDLKIDIDRVNIAASSVPLTLLHIIESLGVLNSLSTDKRYSNVTSKARGQKAQQNASDTCAFNSLRINYIDINLVSALLSSGDFSKPEALRVVGQNLEFVQKNPELLYGSLKSLTICDGDAKIGYFQGDTSKSDVRFEKKVDEAEFTLLFSKNFDLHLTRDRLQTIVNLSSLSSQISESLRKLSSGVSSSPQTKSSTLVQTSIVTVILKVSEAISTEIKVSPISYDSNTGSLSISKVVVSRSDEKGKTQFISVLNSNLKSHSTERQVKSYDNNGHEVVLVTPLTLSIKSIEAEHSFSELQSLGVAIGGLVKSLDFPLEEIYFKTRKKARISSNAFLQSKQSIKLLVELETLKVLVSNINPKFGDIEARLSNISYLLQKENVNQFHISSGSASRVLGGVKQPVFEVIYPDDRSAPILSARMKDFKVINVFLRNVEIDYYTKWLSLFDNGQQSSPSGSGIQSGSETSSTDSGFDLKLKLVDFGIGLNPGRQSSKAVLVTSSGNIDISLSGVINVKAEFRAPVLVLIDDATNILSIEEAKRHRNVRNTWSLVSFYNSRSFVTVAKSKTITLGVSIKQAVDSVGPSAKSVNIDVLSDLLEFELCADSSQCLLQLFNDLKQPVTINPDSKYRVQRHDIDVFGDVSQDAFNGNNLLEGQLSLNNGSEQGSTNEPLKIFDGYYDEAQSQDADILDKDLSELTINDDRLGKNPFYTGESAAANESTSNESDSLILFNDSHFEGSLSKSLIQQRPKAYPLTLKLSIGRVIISIFDGYDWKYTRKTISKAVKNLEQKVTDQQKMRDDLARRSQPRRSESPKPEHPQVYGETLFDSIHVLLPVNTENPSVLTDKINKNLQNAGNNDTIEFGKNTVKKLKLRRTKYHKVLIELKELNVGFILLNGNDPIESETAEDSGEYDVINETVINVRDFEVTDNVPTSTWNKFVTILKDVDRENDTSMLKLKITTIRPVQSLAATEIIMDVEVLPLRLHVDQDTLEALIRFGEFKDSRFMPADEFEDIIYIQKFTINAIRIKLDYKPKKIDYSGLRSGRTTELMNLFILDEAAMVLKQATLYGISGFPKLGLMLNDLWMPDIKQTQLSGVLSGLAPVRSFVKIGSGFKDLVVVPVNEYKKDGRFYRSVSKGLQQFSKNTTNELLKFGIKIANGTQTLLEHTEEALGGVGSSARVAVDLTQEPIGEVSEHDSNSEDDYDYDYDYDGPTNGGASSQLIGKSSLRPQPLYRSIYQPTLESIANINQDSGRSGPRRMKSRFVRDPPALLDYDDLVELNLNDGDDDEAPKTISLYANQPTNLREGLLLAYDSLGKNFLVAKDAIINAGGEISESGSAQETTKALLKAAPVTLIRPMIGATEAASRALFGLNNQLDPSQRNYTEDKYKQFKN